MKRLILLVLAVVGVLCVYAQDVDTHVVVNEQEDPYTFVLIISNENYKYEQPVPFALNDGDIFRLYCEKTLGVPVKNIRYVSDATLNDMRMQLMWLEDVMNAFQGEARAIVYYSGHGMPSENGRHAYLLPVDGNSRLSGSGLSTEQLYKQLGQMPSRGTIVFLDACFSGARRDGQMLASNRGVAIKVKDEPITGKMVVFSAAQGDETAYPYQEHKHGLFTYYLLSSLQEKGGFVSLGELCDQVTKMVTRTSIIENSKRQTPSVNASSASSDWREWMLATKPAKQIGMLANAPKPADSTPKPPTSEPTTQPMQSQPTASMSQTAVVTETKGQLEKTAESVSATAPQTVKTITVGNVSFNMIRVEGGTFQMGATSEHSGEASDWEKPVHQVTLSSYYMGETEVTQELWQAVMGSNPSNFKGAQRPVDKVSWNDCQAFVRKLNQQTGLTFRLPTEAEWEYAARGGHKSQSHKYSGIDNLDVVAWYKNNCNSQTHNVKTKQANELGLYDMSGNVWEWCNDWLGKYTSDNQTNPTGPATGLTRVRRGGSWNSNSGGCRVSIRGHYSPNNHLDNLGLRLAL